MSETAAKEVLYKQRYVILQANKAPGGHRDVHSKQHLAYTDRSLTNEQVSHVLQKHTTGKQQGTDTKDTVVLNRQAQIKKKKKNYVHK